MAKKRDHNYLVFRGGKGPNDLERLVAEQDDDLDNYYVAPERFVARATDVNDRAAFYIGPKGVGKSAILQMVRLSKLADASRIIDITPEDIAFSSLANTEFQNPLLTEPAKHMLLFKSLWDLVLVVELLKREEPNLTSLRERVLRFFDRTEQRKFRNELVKIATSPPGEKALVQKVLQLVDTFEVSLTDPTESASVKVTGSRKKDDPESESYRTLLMINAVAGHLKETLSSTYYVLIDDLD